MALREIMIFDYKKTDNKQKLIMSVLVAATLISVSYNIMFNSAFAGSAPLCLGNIDFDTFPDGTPIPDQTKLTTQYSLCGVSLFTSNDPQGPEVRSLASSSTSSTPNVLIAQPKNTEDPIGIQFVSPVSEASINAIGVGFNGLILDAFNSADELVDSVRVVHPGTPTGSDILTVSGDDIVRLFIHQITPGGKQGFLIDGYFIDDLTFTLDVPVDATPPVITLLGESPVILLEGESYVEAGATVTDDSGEDLSGALIIDATAVDTSVAGTYIVTYDVSDSSGNTAIQVTRTVIVQTPQDATDDLIDDVQDLIDDGTLNNGQGNALTSKLANIIDKLDKGKTNTACNQLDAFINQVTAFINGGTITKTQGQALIDAAQAIQNSAGC